LADQQQLKLAAWTESNHRHADFQSQSDYRSINCINRLAGAREEYLILEGEAIEHDGTVLRPGDWIVYEPGSYHATRTETGCLLVGLDWDPPGRS